jgi:hypothetical protein
MGKTQTKIIVVLAVVAVAVAVFLTRQQEKESAPGFETRKLFENVAIDDLARVEIAGEDETITLRKISETEWGLASRNDYPVDSERLRRLVLAALNLEVIDRLTSNSAKYDRLGVGDEPENGRVALLGGTDKPLALLFLGKRREATNPEGGFAPAVGQFVRAEGDPAVYVSKEVLSIDKQPAQWLRLNLIEVKADDLSRIQVEHRDANESFSQSRASTEDPFELEVSLPEGRKLKPGALGNVSRTLANLTLEDVMAADAAGAEGIEYESAYRALAKSGLVYEVKAGERDGKYYVRLSAVAEAVPQAKGVEEAESTPVSVEGPKVAEQVEDFNGRHGKWIYEVQKYAFDGLTKKLSDLHEETKPEAQEKAGQEKTE